MAARLEIGALKEPIVKTYENVELTIKPYESLEKRTRHKFTLKVLNSVIAPYEEFAFENNLPYLHRAVPDLSENTAALADFTSHLFDRTQDHLMDRDRVVLDPGIKSTMMQMLREYVKKFNWSA